FVLLVRRKDVNDTVHRFGGALRVQRAEDQVAGGRRRDGQFDGFQVAHFADENNVRVFAQRAAQSRGKGLGMHADFTVTYQTTFAFVDEFNRVFERDDVVFAIPVRIVHHGGQRGGFAGTGRAGDHDQSAIEHGKFFEHRRQGYVELFKILKRKHMAGNLPERRADAVLLVVKVDAETRDVRNFVAKI